MPSAQQNTVNWFSLNWVEVKGVVTTIKGLYQISKLPSRDTERRLSEIIHEREKSILFDASWLENLSEKFLLQTNGTPYGPKTKHALTSLQGCA